MGTIRDRRKLEPDTHGNKAANSQPNPEAVVLTEAPGDPAAYALLFGEAVRSLSAQEGSLDEIRGRAGVMLSAAGVVSAFLGSATLTAASGLCTRAGTAAAGVCATGSTTTDPGIVVAIYVGIFIAVVLTVVSSALFVLLLPARTWTFRVGTKELLRNYIEGDPPASIPVIHRSLAWYLADSEKKNESSLRRLYGLFWWGAFLFIADLLVWLVLLSATVAARLLT